MPEIFKSENYLSRSDLENHINSLVGQDIKANKEAGHQIVGTKDDLKRLSLSDACTIWGIKVICADKPSDLELKNKIKDSGRAWK